MVPLMLGRLGWPNLGQTLAAITDDDIAVGWRVVSVSSNALATATFTMPERATVWEDARDFGAGWGSWKIPFGGWRFTYGDVGWDDEVFRRVLEQMENYKKSHVSRQRRRNKEGSPKMDECCIISSSDEERRTKGD